MGLLRSKPRDRRHTGRKDEREEAPEVAAKYNVSIDKAEDIMRNSKPYKNKRKKLFGIF